MKIKAKRILVIRNDRIGDLVLTTPVFEVLHRNIPDAKICAFINPRNRVLLKGNPFVDCIIPDDYEKNFKGFLRLVRGLKKQKFDTAIMVVSDLRIAAAIFLAGIKVRVGPATHLYNFLFLNRVRFQHRSRARMHELEYNLDLLNTFNLNISEGLCPLVKAPDEDMDWAKRKLASMNIGRNGRKIVIIHPGSLGSVMMWPERKWAELLKKLNNDETFDCLITGSGADMKWINSILAFVPGNRIPSLAGKDTLGRFIALAVISDVFVSHSTGPMHIAAASGSFTICFMSPLPVQNSKRWGPWQTQKGKNVLTPDVKCPGKYVCIGEKCPYYYCMSRISPDDVYKSIKDRVSNKNGSR